MTEPHLFSDYPQAQLDHDYSQSGEQEIILEAVVGIEGGRFLDIGAGAGDGETFSNTRCLALRGWRGVCVEPAAWAVAGLMELYGDSDEVEVCQAIVTPGSCGLEFFYYAKDDHLSTIDPSMAARWPQVPFKGLTAAAVRLDQLLDWYEGGFSVVSIDAEGLTTELVQTYRLHPAWADVRVLCFEVERAQRHTGFLLPGEDQWLTISTTENNVILAR